MLAACHHKSTPATPPPTPQLDCTGAPSGWPQWALSGEHLGTSCAVGQALTKTLYSASVDDNAPQEKINRAASCWCTTRSR